MNAVERVVCLAGLATLIAVVGYAVAMTLEAMRRLSFASACRANEARILEARVAAAQRQVDLQKQRAVAWSGWRKFVIGMRVVEAPDVVSFYLAPHDKKPLPVFRPGQFITFRLQMPGEASPATRCYSLSDGCSEDFYRVSIKREPRGSVSRHFHDQLRVGDIVDVQAPAGSFCLESEGIRPVVLIGGGIGIAPLVSMLNGMVSSGTLMREVHVFLAMRNSLEHPFKSHLERLDQQHENLHLYVCYSKPFDHDVKGRDYHHTGRLAVGLIKDLLPSNNYLFYMCGPAQMGEDIVRELRDWGVPESDVHYEAFTPASRKAFASASPPAAPVPAGRGGGAAAPAGISVRFNKSDKTVAWTAGAGTLLDLAEANAVRIEGGCRTGNCGCCLVAMLGGKVSYQTTPGFRADEGSCLTCCSVPASDVVLDA